MGAKSVGQLSRCSEDFTNGVVEMRRISHNPQLYADHEHLWMPAKIKPDVMGVSGVALRRHFRATQ